ncbi:hypothetical protein BAE44_0005833 [Dichanthelium oligosanthes]|uniref:Uncharacterized protein n=1 Tax=Dichanthelium oligosanthes TaxID=888268 RepID=A0A1E5W7F5_9POAL|nr:hypothetical protein BAE44_0005833 [Dichanthelium oligosanthes]
MERAKEREERLVRMDEEWRKLGRTTVPDTFLCIAKGIDELLGTVDFANQVVSTFIHVLLSIQRVDGDAINWDDVREQPNAGTMLDDARSEFVRLRELHHMASQVFVLYGTRLELQGLDIDSDPLWQTWQGHTVRPSSTPAGRCRACAPPPRMSGRAGTPSSWPGRFLACPRRTWRRGWRRP